MRGTRNLMVLVLVCLVTMAGTAVARQDMGGWELGGSYDSLYTSSELDKLKGTIKKIMEVVPMEGMAPGVGLVLKDGDGEKVTVHVGPKWFLGDSIGLKRGDKVKIRGCWAEIDGEDIFMGAKIKKGDYFSLKVRLTKDGKPFWTMSPEELAKERAAEE